MDPWPRAWSKDGADRQRLLADMMEQSRSSVHAGPTGINASKQKNAIVR